MDSKAATSAAVERLTETLKAAGFVKGHRVHKYDHDGKLVSTGRHHIEIMASDLAEVAAQVGDHSNTTKALLRGATVHGHGEDHKVIIYADDLFHLLEKVT